MPKFAANLSFLYPELSFEARFAQAAADGFRGVEYLFPYDWPAEQLAERLRAHGLEQVLFNLPPGDWAAGERGLACLPERREEFAAGVDKALAYAQALGCRRLHCMAGLRPAGVAEEVLEATYIANVRHAAERLAEIGATLTIEPINSRIDMPGYWLDSIERGFCLLEAVDRQNVKLQYDIYHAQIIAGDLARTLRAHIGRIGHVQIADNPGRHEPGTGEINYPYLFALLDELGYAGWVGCEYKPRAGHGAGLGWATSFLGG